MGFECTLETLAPRPTPAPAPLPGGAGRSGGTSARGGTRRVIGGPGDDETWSLPIRRPPPPRTLRGLPPAPGPTLRLGWRRRWCALPPVATDTALGKTRARKRGRAASKRGGNGGRQSRERGGGAEGRRQGEASSCPREGTSPASSSIEDGWALDGRPLDGEGRYQSMENLVNRFRAEVFLPPRPEGGARGSGGLLRRAAGARPPRAAGASRGGDGRTGPSVRCAR